MLLRYKYYDLYNERENNNINNVAILRIEQLYPFPEQELKQILSIKEHKPSCAQKSNSRSKSSHCPSARLFQSMLTN